MTLDSSLVINNQTMQRRYNNMANVEELRVSGTAVVSLVQVSEDNSRRGDDAGVRMRFGGFGVSSVRCQFGRKPQLPARIDPATILASKYGCVAI